MYGSLVSSAMVVTLVDTEARCHVENGKSTPFAFIIRYSQSALFRFLLARVVLGFRVRFRHSRFAVCPGLPNGRVHVRVIETPCSRNATRSRRRTLLCTFMYVCMVLRLRVKDSGLALVGDSSVARFR
jgi:hypothetical protein